MGKRKSLTRQVQEVLDSKLKIGSSKFDDKKLNITDKHIYSWSTYKSYLKHSCYFTNWCKEKYQLKDIKSCKKYINEYLQERIDKGLSPYTQKLDASSLAKLYGCSTDDFIKTETRHRKDISRSRGEKTRDKHFSKTKNKDFIDFCKSTGLRRSELKSLKTENLKFDEQTKEYSITVKGKGGRVRNVPIIDSKAVETIKASNGLVWSKIPNGADIHSYRADYCTSIYNKFARPKDLIPKEDRYCCRGDLKGIWYDKKAMEIASRALGHNRISVIAGHYIRKD